MNNPTRLPPNFDLPLLSRQNLPTMYDLPSEDPEEPGLADIFHLDQPQFLEVTFQPENYDPEQVFSAIDLYLYYDINHPNWHKRPDWFAVVGVPYLYDGWDLRLSYVMWQEQVSPIVVVELLSPSTEKEDLGQTVSQPGSPPTKWEVYEQILQVPYYVTFSRYTNLMQAFQLIDGKYQPANLTDGRLVIPQIGLSLGLWYGSYKNKSRLWLRWFTAQGNLILTPEEKLVEAQQETIAAKLQADQAQQEAERLAAKLRELGVDPNTLL